MATEGAPGVSFHASSAGGRTGVLIREKDWSATPLGARDSWPRSLNNYLSMILELPTAGIIFWGPDQIQLYNDGYSIIMGPRHPRYLGAPFRECWPEAYETIHPWMQRVLQKGETVAVTRTLVPLTRYGFTEEAYFTFSFSPLRDDEGHVGGILQIVTEVTDAVLGERRATALHALSNQTANARTMQDATRLAEQVLSRCVDDLPFSLLYVADAMDPEKWVLSGSTGLPSDRTPLPAEVHLRTNGTASFPALSRVVREKKLIQIENLGAHWDGLRLGEGLELSALAAASPVFAADQQSVVAVLVAGISPRLRLDGLYLAFLELVCAQLGTLLAAARAYDDERRRAEALAEVDRAKAEFFSNVSHEFRTPLTLILAPLEDALADSSGSLRGDALGAVHRNALRLLRLVNTLLDFSRIEADRSTSSFEPTDLPVLTAGLAGSFQSLVESAGLKLDVDCPPMPVAVYVDRAHWEKIVLNLVSNAFKFTFEGKIGVCLQASDDEIHLSVSDTGIGIPPHELPRIFDRFHRVEGARGRSFEGTGIGLALVQGLARAHGGSVRAESSVGKGTTFVVSIPRRTAPPTGSHRSSEPSSAPLPSASAYLLEAAHWKDKERTKVSAADGADSDVAHGAAGLDARPLQHVLVADDNADMREYLVRLLSSKWSVETAEDGQAALEAALRRTPDLVLSDVMMPRMDGVALLGALRANARTSAVPFVLLSARAGEEAVVGGFETGADDYLVKPFAARELMARVQTHLDMARLRRNWAEELERANKELEAFTYSVSHDLRAPRRAIDGFAKLLVDDYGATLSGQAGDYLGRIRRAAGRMGQLIEDLIKLSQAGRAPLAREPVNLGLLARRIGSELTERNPGRRVQTSIAAELRVDGDPRLLAVLLENLLGNAWKFTAGRSEARVEVGEERSDAERVFFVRDNGAGFDMGQSARLFAPFQRLHSESEFPGTGIGLATAQRVVSRHGGRIWAEGATDRGATFFFTLPGPTSTRA